MRRNSENNGLFGWNCMVEVVLRMQAVEGAAKMAGDSLRK